MASSACCLWLCGLTWTNKPLFSARTPTPLHTLQVGLQMAMLIVPACYLASGMGLAVTERVIAGEKAARHAENAAALHAADPGNT